MGISPQDNSTPLRIVVNTAAHAPGGGRSFGAVVVGYLGMRTFTPRSVPRLLDSIGGYACIFGLIAMAADAEGLYASLKALASATRANSSLQDMLRHNRAYQVEFSKSKCFYETLPDTGNSVGGKGSPAEHSYPAPRVHTDRNFGYDKRDIGDPKSSSFRGLAL